MYLDRNGKDITRDEWLEEFSRDRIVKQTTLWNGKFVSTVYIGLDYVYETMVFSRGFGRLRGKDLNQIRCDSLEGALQNHNALVKRFRWTLF